MSDADQRTPSSFLRLGTVEIERNRGRRWRERNSCYLAQQTFDSKWHKPQLVPIARAVPLTRSLQEIWMVYQASI